MNHPFQASSRTLAVIALIAGTGNWSSSVACQGAPNPKVDQRRVDGAIEKGVDYLKTATFPPYPHDGIGNYEVLVLWTFVHAGIPETDPKFQEFLTRMLAEPLERTYKVALQAMVLEEIDRVKHQSRIAQCAQFLVDNQCRNGQWDYGTSSPFVKDVPTEGMQRKDVASGGNRPTAVDFGAKRGKPDVQTRIPITKRRDGPAQGDNSNAQYAALGLRACHDAGILIPRDVTLLASRWWRESMRDDVGPRAPNGRPSVASGDSATPAGWCYGKHEHRPYGSMTAGGVGALAIYDYMIDPKKSWKRDPDIRKGLAWLARYFSVSSNPGPFELHDQIVGENSDHELYYYLYALERAAILYDTPKLGAHDWYVEGANWLLDKQKPDGSWDGARLSNVVWDTCFAVLFLKRATRPLDVASEDRAYRK